MPLTKEQLKAIQDIIDRRMLTFSYETIGESALTLEEINRLKRAGLLRKPVRSLVGDSYLLGKLVNLVEKERTRDITYERVLRIARKMPPPTDIEKKAIEIAEEHAGVFIRGLKDSMVRDSVSLGSRARATALRAIQDGVSTSVAERDTISQLRTRLFHTIDDTYRDWQRVAHTEMNTTIQQAIYADIREKSPEGGNQLVYKRPNPDACEHCKRVYLKADGITPKIFRLTDLADNNFGLKARSWRATIGSVHPWCNCQLLALPDGYDFEKQRVIVEPFDGKKRGDLVSSEEYEKLSGEKRQKVGWDAILTHTGKTAKPSE